MDDVIPIQTTYNGYRFRSRLEARTAVFLDALRIPYRYEPEGYLVTRDDNTQVKYLPDFYLPDHDCFLEVKADSLDRESLAKAKALCLKTRKDVYLLLNDSYTEMIAFEHQRWGEDDDPMVLTYYHPTHTFLYAITVVALQKAVEAARSARFEFGETPTPKEVRLEK